MIELQGLGRRFGSLVAVHPLTLTLPPGVIVGLLGANGAGKTTTLNMLATLLPPSEGTALVDGHDIRTEPLEVRRRLGYVPEHASVYEGLTAEEYLDLAGRVRGMDADVLQGRADRFFSHLGLTEARRRRLGTYSKGMRAKVLLAAALLHEPAVLVLDEPLSGLDVASQRLVADLLREFATAGGTVIYSSHVLEQVERLCDVLVLLHEGRLLWEGHVEALTSSRGGAPLAEVFLRMTSSADGRKVSWAELLAGPGDD